MGDFGGFAETRFRVTISRPPIVPTPTRRPPPAFLECVTYRLRSVLWHADRLDHPVRERQPQLLRDGTVGRRRRLGGVRNGRGVEVNRALRLGLGLGLGLEFRVRVRRTFFPSLLSSFWPGRVASKIHTVDGRLLARAPSAQARRRNVALLPIDYYEATVNGRVALPPVCSPPPPLCSRSTRP